MQLKLSAVKQPMPNIYIRRNPVAPKLCHKKTQWLFIQPNISPQHCCSGIVVTDNFFLITYKKIYIFLVQQSPMLKFTYVCIELKKNIPKISLIFYSLFLFLIKISGIKRSSKIIVQYLIISLTKFIATANTSRSIHT